MTPAFRERIDMEWINYHHLLYFYMTAREGGIVRASEVLRISHPTISGQIRELENRFGQKLFEKKGRGLALTETGRVVYRYAEEIFGLGRELLEAVKGQETGKPLRLTAGIVNVIPKAVVYRLLRSAFDLPQQVRLVCREERPDVLFAQLAVHAIDVVLSDAPMPAAMRVKAFSHELVRSGVTFFAPPPLARRLKKSFPKSLDGTPMLIPTEGTTLRRSLDQWFAELGIKPRIVAEFEDSALLKVFGENGFGVFPAPTLVEADVVKRHEMAVIGRTEDIHERYYAITVERRIKHPALAHLAKRAKSPAE